MGSGQDNQWGRPLKARSREKTPPQQKNMLFFSLTLQLLPTRSFAVDYFVSRPLFPFMDRVVFDPHQSPIWFKAIVFLRPKYGPLPHLRTRKSSVPYRFQLYAFRTCGY